MSRRWDEDLVREARLKVNTYATPDALREDLKTFKASNHEAYSKLLAEPNYYEDLAILCERKVLDDEIMRKSFGETLYRRWLRWESAVTWLREVDPKHYEHFERLAFALRDDAPVPFGRRVKRWLKQPIRIWPLPWLKT
ncbi:MAG: hypothetical protein ACHQIG_07360 [Acidimicrobiia bacterium]